MLNATEHGLERIKERSPVKDLNTIEKIIREHTIKAYKGGLDNRLYFLTNTKERMTGMNFHYYLKVINQKMAKKNTDSTIFVFGADRQLITVLNKMPRKNMMRKRVRRRIENIDVKEAVEYLLGNSPICLGKLSLITSSPSS